MGRDKAMLPWQGGTFLSAAIRALQPATDFVLVIAGANVAELELTVNASAAFLVVNPDPQRGQFSSLRIGVQEVLNRGRDAAIITLVDRPAAKPATIQRLKNEFLNADPDIWAVVPEYSGKHGHPIVIGREMISAFLDAPAASNTRDIEHSLQQHVLYLNVDDPLVATNVNTPDDFAKLTPGTIA